MRECAQNNSSNDGLDAALKGTLQGGAKVALESAP